MKFKHAAILIIRGVLVGGLLGGLISFVFRLDIASGAIGGSGAGAILLIWVGLGGNIAEFRNKND